MTAFLRNRGRILVLRRGRTASTFPRRWSGVSGIIEGSERPLTRARKEILEETGISGARFQARGPIVHVRHGSIAFT
ncbi:MAG: NUDIX domain-containing protein, partial [Candidatus Thermoplasmatota archaeon]